MSLPVPKPGLVIRYGFLWSSESADGATEGKDRPCAIVVATRLVSNGDILTIVAPITHRPPDDASTSIEIPSADCRRLGFDDGRHWLRIDELNSFAWPGFDLRSVPGQPDRFEYGMLSRSLFQQLREAVLSRQKARKGVVISRDEDSRR